MEKIITFGEIMLRLTPPDYNKIDQTRAFQANYGGGEANVAVALSHLGHQTYFISKLPPNLLGDSAIKHLKSHGVDTRYVVRGSTTLGIYFFEAGFGGRPSKVIYNRKHSAATRIVPKELDFDKIFKDATLFHVSGISLALGDRVRKVILECLKACKKYSVRVSFDFNYRAKLWSVEEAKPYFQEIMPYVNIVFASYFDINTIIDMPGDDSIEDFKTRREELFKRFINKYNIDYVFGTDRVIFTANENSLDGYCVSKNEVLYTPPVRFNIYDRIGGGDAFASGVIHGLIQDNNNPQYALEFGLVTSVLKHTIYGDASVFKVEDILEYMQTAGIKDADR